MINEKHFTRQSGIISPEKLGFSIGLVGAGAVGSWTALALLKLGCQNITAYDHDFVDDHNVGAQIYTSTDVGTPKVEALDDKLILLTGGGVKRVEARITVENVTELLHHDLIISAVDSIEARSLIFEALIACGWQGIFVDGRMAGNTIEVYTIPMQDTAKVAHYGTRLFPPEKAERVPCSMRSVVYNVFIMAGLITDIVAKIANEQETPKELIVDLFNFTIMGGLL